MILPNAVRSGVTPYTAPAPSYATRKPVITSSKKSRAPCSSQSARSPSRNPGSGGTTPMFAATGSTTTTAISRPRSPKIARTASRSLNGAVIVSLADSLGHAG